MDISRSRFPWELVKIIELIADSHFIAFDLEFSGIAGRRKDGTKPKLQEIYDEVKEAAERYHVLQVGLTVVHEDLITGRYIARPYNFNINPIPASEKLHFERVWSFQSGGVEILNSRLSIAVDFLIRNGFDFGRIYVHGVPYLSRKDEEDIRSAWLSRDLEKVALKDMPTKEEDTPLIDHVHASIKKWQEARAESRESYLNIPNTSEGGIRYIAASKTLNRYQIRLVHQIIRNEYPKLKSAGKGHFIQITTLEGAREISEKLQQARYRDQEISRATEFRWLIEAISGGDITKIPAEYFLNALPSDVKLADGEGGALRNLLGHLQLKLKSRKKIIIGHNCFTDLVYLYNCFAGQLPDSVDEFRDLISRMFPTVIDTKFIASFTKGWRSTSLQDVELELQPEGPGVPVVEIPLEFDRYTVGQRLHEAGYDSLLTAKVAIKLSSKLEKEAKFPFYQELEAQKLETTAENDLSEHYATAPEPSANGEVENMSTGSTPLTTVDNLLNTGIVSADHQFTDKLNEDISDKLEGPSIFSEEGDEQGEREKVNRDLDDTIRKAAKITDDIITPMAPSFYSPMNMPPTQVEILDRVKKGELMPRWEGGKGFWRYFGKKLQVNSAEEEICYL